MIYIFLAEGFEEIEALTPADLLRRAGKEVRLIGLTGREVKGAHGITVVADSVAAETDVSGAECLILPGGMPGTLNLDASGYVDEAIRTVWREGGRLAAICAAPLVLGRRGYLDGKEAICFPGFEKELKGAKISEKVAVTDGRITTGKGMEYALDFAKELVRVLG